MKVPTIKDGSLGTPDSPGWATVPTESVALGPVPLSAQPTAYIRETWASRPYGTTASASVAAASDGQKLYVRLEWADDAKPNTEFQDAAGAVFATAADSTIATLGSSAAPVGVWYWENGRKEALSLASKGPGVVRKDAADAVNAAAAAADGKWSVVLIGPLAAAKAGKLPMSDDAYMTSAFRPG